MCAGHQRGRRGAGERGCPGPEPGRERPGRPIPSRRGDRGGGRGGRRRGGRALPGLLQVHPDRDAAGDREVRDDVGRKDRHEDRRLAVGVRRGVQAPGARGAVARRRNPHRARHGGGGRPTVDGARRGRKAAAASTAAGDRRQPGAHAGDGAPVPRAGPDADRHRGRRTPRAVQGVGAVRFRGVAAGRARPRGPEGPYATSGRRGARCRC